MKKKPKRMVVISDLHCGHLVGLTPPSWHFKQDGKLYKVQKELWNWYISEIKKLKPIDILVVNGDAIDGKGERSGGTEQVTTDRIEQVNMATQCIEYCNAKVVRMTYGTPYHAGIGEDWEQMVAENVGGKIEAHAWFDVNGTVFDFKHKVGGSTIPHGRFTAAAREKLWNTIWNSRDKQQPKADFVIRSHVHYYTKCETIDWAAITTPALQMYGSKYGARQCTGTVDVGFLVFDIDSKGNTLCYPVIAGLPEQTARAEHL